jgi:hypothetical protein
MLGSILLGHEALQRSPSVDERAVDREVLVGEQRGDPSMFENTLQELARDISLEQAVAVLGIYRVVPNWIVHAEAYKPTKHQVVVHLLHKLAL